MGRQRSVRLAGATACAVFCAIPMLVILGAVSLGAVVLGGATAVSAVVVIWLAVVTARGRLQPPPRVVRMFFAGFGVALAVLGLWVSAGAQWRSSLVSVGVAMLSAAALLALADTRVAAG